MLKVKVLIVDDIEDNRAVLSNICKKIGDLEIIEATNGEEAVEICEKEQPHIVLMDMLMPIMDGSVATKLIKESFPSTIIIIVTAVIDSKTEEIMIKSGATAYFTKPIDRELIRFKLKNYISLINHKKVDFRSQSNKNAVNPFSRDIRSFKTIFQIENGEDLMDFGIWILAWFNGRDASLMYSVDVFIGFLYTNIQTKIKNNESITVIIEENFDELFLSIVMDSEILLITPEHTCFTMIQESIIVRDNTMYVHLNLQTLRDCLKTKVQNDHNIRQSIAIGIQELKQTYKPADKIRAISENERSILRKSFGEKTSATTYISDIGGDVLEEIGALESADFEWNEKLNFLSNKPEAETLISFVDLVMKKYIHAIGNLFEFASLSHALDSLGEFIKKECNTIIENNKTAHLIELLSHLGGDLSSWRMHIFVKQDAKDIHYLDSSFFSSCMQIESIVSQKTVEHDDLELF